MSHRFGSPAPDDYAACAVVFEAFAAETLNPDLRDEEHTELVRALRDIIEVDRFPLSPCIRLLKAILAKLEAARPGLVASSLTGDIRG